MRTGTVMSSPPPANPVDGHGSSWMRRCTKSRDLAAHREQRQRQQRPEDAVQLGAGDEREDHEQRMRAERLAHHARHDHVALELVHREVEETDPERRVGRVDRREDDRGDRAEDRADVRDDLGRHRPQAEDQRVRAAAGPDARQREDLDADAGARADQQRDRRLPAHVPDQPLLHLRSEADPVRCPVGTRGRCCVISAARRAGGRSR